MTTVLLIIIYLAFIGLGIPDAIFGAAWPAVANQFQIPVSYANFVTIIISTGTIVSSLISARLINRFGPGIVTAVSTSMTAFALLGFSISGNMVSLCLFAVPLGVGAGTIDAALNNYVALHYKASHMNFIACFYGIGITISPFLMSFALKEQNNWHMGYRTVFYLQSAVALVTIFSVPLWYSLYANNKLENNPYWSMDYISGNRAFIFAAASAVQRRSALFHWCGQRTDLPEFDLSDTPEFWKRSIAVCDGYSNGSRKHRYSCIVIESPWSSVILGHSPFSPNRCRLANPSFSEILKAPHHLLGCGAYPWNAFVPILAVFFQSGRLSAPNTSKWSFSLRSVQR